MNKESLKNLCTKSWTFDSSNKIKKIIADFSIAERAIFYGLVGVFALSALTLLYQVNKSFLVEVPTYGGTLTEGIIGTPRFVNPLIALSDADRDITSLVYSGLLKTDSSGTLIPDLASSYTVSPDGLTYTFILKKTAMFTDGTQVTADDVVFTIQKIQDQALKSPKENLWNGVSVKKVDAQTVVFILNKAYAPFIYNTTVGILPKHIWSAVTDESFPFSQFNTKPVGSGPYIVETVKTDGSGLPTEYDLTANTHYTLGEPYITHIVLKMYQNEDALIKAYNSGDVDTINSVTPEDMKTVTRTDNTIVRAPLQRVFGVFFNQNQNPVLVNKEVRVALNQAVDTQAIIQTVLSGYGQALDGPLPSDTALTTSISGDDRIATAKATLEKAGWVMGTDGIYTKQDKKTKKTTQTLTLSISTSDVPELKAEAEMIQQMWTKMGAKVDVKIFEVGDLNQNIIRPRKYDALLFGEIISPPHDLYPFWHSSERNDPGLNIALYTNIKADGILETLRRTTDKDAQITLEQQFENQVSNDVPAIFLYAPDFIYLMPTNIHTVPLGTLTVASDRFANVNQWYTETSSIWKIFLKNKPL